MKGGAFTWSKSREKVFLDCKRRYYYKYYASHLGWTKKASEDAKHLYRLKNLESLASLLGTIFHNEIAEVVKAIRGKQVTPSKEEFSERVRRLFFEAVAESDEVAGWMEKPKQIRMLREKYYKEEGFEEAFAEMEKRLEACADGFFASETFLELSGAKYFYISEIDDANAKTIPVFHRGRRLFAKPDLVYRIGNKWTVADWKTGKEREEDSEQIALYGARTKGKNELNSESLVLRLEYLGLGKSKEAEASDAAFRFAEEAMEESARQMESMLEDVEGNVAKSAEHFPKTDSEEKCKTCEFLEYCSKDRR